ncbi:hypothetical protein Bca52824_008299 [Brassica carinata]|uniref:Uncharacterized protein n=1 Tax=Brassica carinata TaxID=52824 RepID=A0A8X7W9J9_BRACI|nr:hypothetical protein Bca52824_008299 [Brassica carinata]
MVSTPPSCLRPPPDPPPPPSFFWLMQHYSSSLKMMVTALPPPSQPGPPPDPSPNKHFPVETLSPVKPPEPADPPDVSVSFVLLRIFVTFSRSSPQATQILHLMWVSSKLRDGDAALVVISFSTFFSCAIQVISFQRSFPVIYRSYLFNVLFL